MCLLFWVIRTIYEEKYSVDMEGDKFYEGKITEKIDREESSMEILVKVLLVEKKDKNKTQTICI